jgi:hypothetical protein
MLGIIVYHFHTTYTAKSAFSVKATKKFSDFKELFRSHKTQPSMEAPVIPAAQDSNRVITRTVIELREPLLEQINA